MGERCMSVSASPSSEFNDVNDSHASRLLHELLALKHDRYYCITINLTKLAEKLSQSLILALLEDALANCLSTWKKFGVHGVWVHMSLQLAAASPNPLAVFAAHGFTFHHALAHETWLSLWLTEGVCKLPTYATHTLGVAGVVLDHSGQVLLVKERFTKNPMWKFPGGLAEPGESLAMVAERETFEETGVEARFECVLTLRHMHGWRWGASDIYVACLLRTLSNSATPELQIDSQEIAEACWMPLEEYIEMDDLSSLNKFTARRLADYLKGTAAPIAEHALSSYHGDSFDLVYFAGDC